MQGRPISELVDFSNFSRPANASEVRAVLCVTSLVLCC